MKSSQEGAIMTFDGNQPLTMQTEKSWKCSKQRLTLPFNPKPLDISATYSNQ